MKQALLVFLLTWTLVGISAVSIASFISHSSIMESTIDRSLWDGTLLLGWIPAAYTAGLWHFIKIKP